MGFEARNSRMNKIRLALESKAELTLNRSLPLEIAIPISHLLGMSKEQLLERYPNAFQEAAPIQIQSEKVK